MKLYGFLPLIALATTNPNDGCDPPPTTNAVDQQQAAAQAQSLAEAHKQVGNLPAIRNFQELRMAKDIYELRDTAIATHTYLVNEMQGCLVYLGPSIGYGLPYATQFTAPTKVVQYNGIHEYQWQQVPQAEPNGLFMPAAAEGTWVMMLDEKTGKAMPQYIEPRVLVTTFRMTDRECAPTTHTTTDKR